MSSPIDHRIKRFAELHNNKWFHVMNWNLDFMKTADKKHRSMHAAFSQSFYMAAAPVEPKTTAKNTYLIYKKHEKLITHDIKTEV
jgi:3-deoxy-D-arabino-heptulosonate 7-phosphate (DAHP) synthase class II